MAFELHVLSRVNELPQATWDALVTDDDSPFVEWTWLDCLEEAGCVGAEAGWLPCHLALYDAGELVALAPTYLKDNSEGEFIFDWNWADLAQRMRLPYYPKVVVGVPFTPATGARVLTAKGKNRADLVRTMAAGLLEIAPEMKAHSVHALFTSDAETESWRDAGYSRRASVQFQWTNRGYATFDDFLATFNAKKRAQVKREVRQADKDGVEIVTLSPAEHTAEMARQMFDFYVTTVDKFRWGRRYLNPLFFQLIAARWQHRLAWVVARKGGETIAGAFNVAGTKRLYGRYWGATVDLPFLHFNVCYYHGIKEAIARGLEAFEPGAGGEHKRARGFLPTVTHSAHWIRDPRMRAIIDAFVEREREAVLRHCDAAVTEP